MALLFAHIGQPVPLIRIYTEACHSCPSEHFHHTFFALPQVTIKYAVAFRLAPESFYSVRSRGGLQMSLGLRTGDRASASANRYRVSFPLRERRTPTSLALAPAGEPVGLVSSDPPFVRRYRPFRISLWLFLPGRRLSQIPRGPGRQNNDPALLSGAIPGQDHALSIAGLLSA